MGINRVGLHEKDVTAGALILTDIHLIAVIFYGQAAVPVRRAAPVPVLYITYCCLGRSVERKNGWNSKQ